MHYKQMIRAGILEPINRLLPLADSPTYRSWTAMRERCHRNTGKHYARYKGRGITVCERWDHSFPEFYEDMGVRPSNKTLDRIDNNGGYWCGKCSQCLENGWPMNCRWATPREQNLNSSQKNKHGYPGVRSKGLKFEAWIRLGSNPNKKYLGTFNTPKEAGAAYMEAKKQLDSLP
jgi:hypothetical protein